MKGRGGGCRLPRGMWEVPRGFLIFFSFFICGSLHGVSPLPPLPFVFPVCSRTCTRMCVRMRKAKCERVREWKSWGTGHFGGGDGKGGREVLLVGFCVGSTTALTCSIGANEFALVLPASSFFSFSFCFPSCVTSVLLLSPPLPSRVLSGPLSNGKRLAALALLLAQPYFPSSFPSSSSTAFLLTLPFTSSLPVLV